MSLTFQLIGLLLIEVSMVPYLISIFKGITKPTRVTYFIWSLLGFIELYSCIQIGAFDTILITTFVFINPVIIFLLSIKHGMPGRNKFDVFCFCGALMGIIVLFGLDAPLEALILTITVDFIGTLPLLRKSFLFPYTEDLSAWVIYGIGTVFGFFAITEYSLEQTLYPVFLIIEGMAILLCIQIGRFRTSSQKLL